MSSSELGSSSAGVSMKNSSPNPLTLPSPVTSRALLLVLLAEVQGLIAFALAGCSTKGDVVERV